jgi:hypothetical protein
VQITKRLADAHDARFVHEDLHTNNVLVFQGNQAQQRLPRDAAQLHQANRIEPGDGLPGKTSISLVSALLVWECFGGHLGWLRAHQAGATSRQGRIGMASDSSFMVNSPAAR